MEPTHEASLHLNHAPECDTPTPTAIKKIEFGVYGTHGTRINMEVHTHLPAADILENMRDEILQSIAPLCNEFAFGVFKRLSAWTPPPLF
jgi:hypothetical protein